MDRNDRRVGLVILVIVCGVVAAAFYSVKYPQSAATPTPSSSYAYRNIPISQMTGADWLTMSFTERERLIAVATQRIHCPSSVTTNDLAIAITQAANTQTGQSLKVIDLLAVQFGLSGCVTG